MRWAFLITLLVCCAGMTRAETITLRSGEHEDFARLVAFLPADLNWDVAQNGRKVEVRIDAGKDHDFDTGAVFDRIPRTRIAAVTQAGRNRLSIDLACDCEVSSFFQSPRMLVIDVRDATAPLSSRTTRSETNPPPRIMREALHESLVARQSYSTSSLSQFAEALAQQTTRDVLDLNADPAGRGEVLATLDGGLRNLDLPNIAAAPGKEHTQNPPGRGAGTCDNLAQDPLGRFADPGDFATQKAQLTSRLYTERLNLDADVATDMAQLYLAHGLGAEARQMLQVAGTAGGGAAYLVDLAVLIEHPDRVERQRVEGFEHCAPGNILWSVMAQPRKPMAAEDGWKVARAAEALPRPLLRAIAPRLIANLVASGQPEPGGMIDKIIDRAGGAEGKSMADVLLSENESEQQDILDDIAQSNSEDAAEASALLVERHIEAGETVPKPLSELVASHAEEQRHGDASGMLRKAEAFSLISRGEFEPALAILKSGVLGAGEQAETVSRFFGELARKADTVTFLKVALSETALSLAASPSVRQSVAARLYENSFASAASALVNASEPLDPSLLANALGARLFGEVGIPDEVLFAEAGVGPEADEARYHALLSAGRFAEARQVGLGLGLADPVDALLSLPAEPALRDGNEPREDAPEVTLARATALTESTSDLARTVSEMLGDPALAVGQ